MTKVQIISFALSLLGRKPIISLENQNDITSAAEQAFDFLVPVILSTGQWRFATKIQQLSKLVTTPVVDDWTFIFEIPSDYLKLIRLYPHTYAFEIYEDRHLYSNVDGPLYIEYVFEPSIFRFPAYFNNYLAYRIAENLALSNAQTVSFSQKLSTDMGVAMAVGLAADAQNRPETPMQSQPIIVNRAVNTLVNG
jgi:hypothetical protein